jgi:MurNAc alpha-1-phosphate uridylyltransferase
VKDLCAVVLAAGEGTRLRPLTSLVPKALCPVGNRALLDHALDRAAGLGLTGPDQVAVNACYLAEQIVEHCGSRVRLSVEPGPRPLGTSGGLARLRDWIANRAVVVGNADAYLAGADLSVLLDGWDGDTVRILGVPAPDGVGEFKRGMLFAGYTLLPWWAVAALPVTATELVFTAWRPAERADRLEVVPWPGTYLDTGTPQRYLAANLHALAGAEALVDPSAEVTGALESAVVGAGAAVHGKVTRAVVWPGAVVGADEHLVDVVRAGRDLTVAAG